MQICGARCAALDFDVNAEANCVLSIPTHGKSMTQTQLRRWRGPPGVPHDERSSSLSCQKRRPEPLELRSPPLPNGDHPALGREMVEPKQQVNAPCPRLNQLALSVAPKNWCSP